MKKSIVLCMFLSFISFSNGIRFENNNINFNNVKTNKNINKENVKKTVNNKEEKIKILMAAKKLLGKNYLYGASINDLNNFDCSSFVKRIYKEAGLSLPRTSKEQSQVGKKINRNSLEIGDLVFFNTLGNGVSHVGMYIGNNKFVHASSKADKIIVSNLSGYYLEKFMFGTKIV